MASIAEIRQASAYTGDANLGGGTLGALNITTKPIEQLAYYTMLYNKSEYEQREKDTQMKIAELSEVVAFDPMTGIKKDRDILVPKLAETIQKASEVARRVPKTHQERIDQMYELRELKSNMKNLIQHGTVRGTTYETRKAAIDSNPDYTPEQKELMKGYLEEEANNTPIEQNLSATEKFDLSLPKLNPNTTRTFDVVYKSGNEFITSKVTEFDYKTNMADAQLTANGWNQHLVEEGTPEWNALSDTEKRYQKLQKAGKSGAKGTSGWILMADNMDKAMHSPEVIDPATGKPDIAKLRQTNPTLNGIFDLADAHNREIKRKKAAVHSGQYIDGDGNIVGQLPQGAVEGDYQEVDYSDGLSAAEIAYLQKWSQHTGDKIDKDINYYGAADKLKAQREGDEAAMRRTLAAKTTPAATGSGEVEGADGNVIDKVTTDVLYGEDGKPLNWVHKDENGNTSKVMIKDGVVQTANGTVLDTGTGTYKVPIASLDASILDLYEKYNRGGTADAPIGQKIATETVDGQDMVTIKIDRGVITGVKNSQGAFVDRNTYQSITTDAQQKIETKYKSPNKIGTTSGQKTSGGVRAASGGAATTKSISNKTQINKDGTVKAVAGLPAPANRK